MAAALAANNPPWLPEAPAVRVLDSWEVRYLDTRHSVTLWRGVNRVATDGGRAVAGVFFPYNADTDRILSAKVWVVSADGKKTQSFQRGDFVDRVAQINQLFWDAERILQFGETGRVEIGGAIGWEIQCDQARGIDDSSTSFLPEIPTARAVFEVVPAPGTSLQWFALSPDMAPVNGAESGALRWEAGRKRPLGAGQPSDFLPDPQRVSVRCVPAGTAAGAATWGAFSRLVSQIMEPRLDSTGAVKAEAEELVAGKTGRWQRIRALAEFVQRQIVYLEITLDKDTLAGYRPHPAATVLKNRYGDCKDKATLLVSLLRAIGEDGRLVLLYSGNPKFVDAQWPSAEFNHAIAAIPVDADCPAWWPIVDAGPLGRFVIFDPTDSIAPLGVLSSGDQAGFGLIVDSAAGTLVRLPISEPEHNQLKRTAEATLDAQGNLAVKIAEERIGPLAAASYAARWNQTREQYQAVLEREVQQGHPFARDLTWSDDWQGAEARFERKLSFSVPDYGRRSGGSLMLLDPNILPDNLHLRPWTTRNQGVSWLAPDEVVDEARFTLPPGMAIEELPDPYSDKIKTISVQLSYSTEGNVVVYQRHILRQPGFYEKADYEALIAFYQRFSAAERQPVILRQTAPR
jgi:hypothetical protein